MRRNFQFSIFNFQAGFTLIELLVVISIIGVLATLVISNMAGVRERARDAQRKSDIAQIQRALEMSKGNQSLPAYPAALSALATSYMQTVPNDPNCPGGTCTGNWPNYTYTKNPGGSGDITYKIFACLENKSDPQKDSDQSSCPNSCRDPNSDSDPADGGVCFSRIEP